MSKEILEKKGRLVELDELIREYRIEIDEYLKIIKDNFGVRNADLSYVEKIDLKKIKIFFKEIERKQGLLAAVVKEKVMLREELGIVE